MRNGSFGPVKFEQAIPIILDEREMIARYTAEPTAEIPRQPDCRAEVDQTRFKWSLTCLNFDSVPRTPSTVQEGSTMSRRRSPAIVRVRHTDQISDRTTRASDGNPDVDS
jgi:hypothetical protein